MRLPYLLVATLACLAAQSVAQPPGREGPPPARVVVDAARVETVERWREVTGELRAVRRSVVAAEQEGQVVEINIEPGDAVVSGQIVARLDDVFVRLELERAEATILTRKSTLAERQALLDRAKRDKDRIEQSAAQIGASPQELDERRTAVAEAEARLAQSQADIAWAESDLRRTQSRLDRMVVKAPFDGTIVSKRTEAGQWVQEGDEVVEIIALGSVDAWLDVPESAVMRLLGAAGTQPGGATTGGSTAEIAAPVEVEIRLGTARRVSSDAAEQAAAARMTLRAPISGIVPTADPLSRLFPVRVRLANKDRLLRPGMSVVGVIPTGQPEQALTIQKDAVLRNEAGTYVFVNAGGTAQIASVEVLYATGTRLVVRSPALKEGSQIVVEGNERLFPGQPLVVMNAPPAPPQGTKPTP